MTQARIIGVGSPFGDDQIGWDAVEALLADGLIERYPPRSVEACCCGNPVELLMLSKDAQAVFIIDAMKSGAEVGTVRRFGPNQLESNQTFISTHGVSVAEAVALGQTLNLLPATLVLYGIEIHPAVLERQKTVRAAIPVLLRAIAIDLESFILV